MTFPLSVKGRLSIDNGDVAQVSAAVENLIRTQQPSTISVGDGQIQFTANIFREVSKSNLLNSVGAGQIVCRRCDRAVEVRYRISFVQLLFITSVFTLVFAAVVFAAEVFAAEAAASRGSQFPKVYLVWLWAWLFFGNYVWTIIAFPAALREAASSAARANGERNV